MLRPFFTFYGGKWRAAPKYPAPRYGKIIEPFAGSAGYSIRYAHLDVTLYEIDPAVFGVWDYLTKVSEAEILALPSTLSHVDEIIGPQEARWLVGFWLNKGCERPMLTPSRWMRDGTRPHSFWGETVKFLIARQLQAVRHWRVVNSSGMDSGNSEATWFIDPPYRGDQGARYRCRVADYGLLGDWCRSRAGQVIVCECTGADWLPFRHFGHFRSTGGALRKSVSAEAIWTNDMPVRPPRQQLLLEFA